MNKPRTLSASSSQNAQESLQCQPAGQAGTQPKPEMEPKRPVEPEKAPAEQTKDDVARLENEGGPTPAKDKVANAD